MLKLQCLMAVSLLGVAGCSVNASADSACTPPPHELFKPVMPNLQPYFPAGLAEQGERAAGKCHPRLAASRAEMFSSLLAELKEPVISTGQNDALRFEWAGSFNGFAVVRIEPRDGRQWLVARYRADGVGESEKRSDRALSPNESSRLDALLNRDPFGDATDAGPGGLDGSHWLLERMEGGNYQLVQRWSPQKARVREVGEYLAKLAGFGPPQMY